MKKPTLEDFNLNENKLIQNKKEHALYHEKLNDYLREKKRKRRLTFVISILLTIFLAFLYAISSHTLNVFSFVVAISYGVCFWWTLAYGISLKINKEKKNDTISNIPIKTANKIKIKTINQTIENSIIQYNKQLEEYNKKKDLVNENSLVKVEIFTFLGTPLGTRWIAFSNRYLENTKVYPNIKIPTHIDKTFESNYSKLLEIQKNNPPIPKKKLKLTEELYFFYPCSDLFLNMKQKKKGDIIEVSYTKYKILNIINPQNLE